MNLLTHTEARFFYGCLGAKQDWQQFFEDRAACDLVNSSRFAMRNRP